jgi:hypothetical protein
LPSLIFQGCFSADPVVDMGRADVGGSKALVSSMGWAALNFVPVKAFGQHAVFMPWMVSIEYDYARAGLRQRHCLLPVAAHQPLMELCPLSSDLPRSGIGVDQQKRRKLACQWKLVKSFSCISGRMRKIINLSDSILSTNYL